MAPVDYMDWHEVLFSAHSCAIEGNSFTVDDTRILKEQGLAMIPVGRSLLECTEMADHFRVFRYMTTHLDAAFDETLLCETYRLVTENTLAYRAPGAVAGAYTTMDMAAGDIIFGDREAYINALRQKRIEGTDECLIAFFFRTAIEGMEGELAQKRSNSHLGLFLF